MALERSLEYHHRHPFGFGGNHDPDNICLMCPAHNRYLAELDYGRKNLHPRERGQLLPDGVPTGDVTPPVAYRL